MPPTKRKHAEATATSQETEESESAESKKPRIEEAANTTGVENPEGETTVALVESSSFNLQPQGILRLPVELQEEILDYLQHPTLWTTVGDRRVPIIPTAYTERNKALRCLASTCVAYRQVFLPLAWRHVLICTIGETDNGLSYYKTVGETLARKCKGLMKHPELAEHVQ